MKLLLFSFLILVSVSGFSQNLQVHYDARHSLDPSVNPANYPTFSFEYFKNLDTAGTGSFLMKVQVDLSGKNNNVGQVFSQLSQSLRWWKPKIYLSLNYSGGLGLSGNYGYNIANSYGVGVSYPFKLKNAWMATSLLCRYNAFEKSSYDPQFTIYFGSGFFKYRIFVAGSFVCWTQNNNQGNELTKELKGKKFAFFGDPQVWIKIHGNLSAGSRINVYYNIITPDPEIKFYPTLGLKYQFE